MRAWVLLLLFVSAAAWSQGAYRWVDEQGKVHYGDRPPASLKDKAAALELEDRLAEKELPYETRQAMKDFPVTFYLSDDCGEPCDKAREFLVKRAVPFSDKKLVSNEDIKALAKLLETDAAVPTLQVGSKLSRGFEEGSWNRLLDAAGYPKPLE